MMSEADVQRAVWDFLHAAGYIVFRRNVAGRNKMEKGGWLKVGEKGQADLYGWHRVTGRHLECEVKSPGKFPTPEQSVWLLGCREAGAVAIWCDSVEMCRNKLDALAKEA